MDKANDTAKPFKLFAHEERIAVEARRALAGGKLSVECTAAQLPSLENYRQRAAREQAEAITALPPLLEDYFHLQLESRQLIRIADQHEAGLNRLNRKLEALTRSLAHQASHDRLTGALNKGAASERIAQHLANAQGSLLMIDIDHFKQINDTFGHLAGDRVLAGLAGRLQELISDGELFGRFGGDEFVVVSRETSLFQARALAERLRRGAEEHSFDAGTALPLSVTLSIGLTLCETGETIEATLGRADSALYAAKRGGHNRVESES